jgi:zinc transporter ZupT
MWLVLLLSFAAAFADIIGGALTIFKKLNQKEIHIVTGLGTGFLLGATLLDRLPDAMTELPKTGALYITIGYLLLLAISKYSTHTHEVHVNVNEAGSPNSINRSDLTSMEIDEGKSVQLVTRQSALTSFISLLIHTFIDGVIIAGAFSINRSTGILIFLAITLHKIPEGFSIASIYLAAGRTRKRAILTSSGLALSTLIGALFTLELRHLDPQFIRVLMALATGTFLYISTSELVPTVQGKRLPILAVLVGVLLFGLSLLLVKHVGLS